MINTRFWQGKRVFVTGHTGFKGAWLCEWLLSLGAEVKGYSLPPPTTPAIFDVLKLDRKLHHVVGDIRDGEKMAKELLDFRPDVVFHLAAQPLVRLSYVEPKLTYETNVMGALNLYEAVRKSDSVRALVSITTDKCYENKEWAWGYRENDPMGGYDPYSSSKGCVELLSSSYRNSFFHPKDYGTKHQVALATARAGNVIGGGDWALDRLVPDCVRSLAKKETITIRSPYATRPWQHVMEPLCGYLMLAEQLWHRPAEFADGWNFGPGDEGVLNVEDVVKTAISAWGSGAYEISPDASLHEAQLLKLDPSKARAKLKWHTKWSAAEAIAASIVWYRAFYEGADVSALTLAQLRQFSDEGKV